MAILATAPRITSAAVVLARRYGGVSRHARQRGVCRQRVYREADWVRHRLDDQPLRQECDQLRQRVRHLEQRLAQAPGRQAGPLLAVCDDYARPRVCQASADEIYVSDPVLMVVEPDSLCWVAGRLADSVSGDAWLEEFRRLPALEQLTRDAGTGLRKGVALLNAERQ